jgi:hypothetical protein
MFNVVVAPLHVPLSSCLRYLKRRLPPTVARFAMAGMLVYDMKAPNPTPWDRGEALMRGYDR